MKDHAEIMGESLEAVAGCLAQSITNQSRTYLPNELKSLLGNYLIDEKLVSYHEPHTFTKKYSNIPEKVLSQNWGLIKTLARDFEMDDDAVSQVFDEIWTETDKSLSVTIAKHNTIFYNLFSINDIDSAMLFVEHLRYSQQRTANEIVILNTRADRPLRTRDFIGYLSKQNWISQSWITGSGRYLARRSLGKSLLNNKIRLFKRNQELLEMLPTASIGPSRLFGLANYRGVEPLVEALRKLS